MRKNGLNQPLRYVSASDSVANVVLEGQAAAGFTSMANFQSLTPEVQSQLRILVESEPMAGRVYVLNSSQLSRKATIEAALQSFAQSEDGKAYFAKYKLIGYRKLLPKELSSMDPFAAEIRLSLK
jgi:phosphonate transport system substrate-binding protein